MEEPKPDSLEDNADLENLDTPSTSVDTDVISAESDTPIPVGPPPKDPVFKRLIKRLFSFNIYLLLFVFVLVVAGVVVFFSYNYSKKKSGTDTTISATSLSEDTLNQLANSDASVGTSSQVLNVQSSAVFAGKVLARSDLEVAGSLQIGGDLNLPNINVTEIATLGQVDISRNLSVTGNSAVQGAQTIGQGLQVGGGGTFNGTLSAPQITTNNFQLNGDLVLTRHITAGGGTPGRSTGTALGSGGTASIGGSDTAGSISVNTGSGPGAGCFINVTFTTKYNATPHVLVTPIGSAAGEVDFYVNRSATGFSVCSSNAPPAGSSFGFDYFVVG